MTDDLQPRLADAEGKLAHVRSTFDVPAKRTRAAALHDLAAQPGFWDDQAAATRQMAELARLDDDLKSYDRLAECLEEAGVLHALALEEADEATQVEAVAALDAVEAELEALEVRTLLSGEHDEAAAIVSVHAGAGGTESCDWAEMLLRMYLRWAEHHAFKVELVEVAEGEEAGIKRATFTLEGRSAYGLMSAEKGVHRLVRISPFDASKRRHTSFASVDVVPALADEDEVEIDPKELRIDTYHSSGAGGQHVNVTDSAVRITHLPTGIVVSVQNERSQIQNRAVAMKILGARLAQRAAEERMKELDEIRGEQMENTFGSQIRSYVLAPYQLVKDHRTGVEVGNVEAVLDGYIDGLITAELRRRASKPGASN
ncbi:MAG TPA: peptide chain release factor 2 [Actinomycetota bacterium]|nr:peptide chain release factor 2 [Actinomycetota bacterium]